MSPPPKLGVRTAHSLDTQPVRVASLALNCIKHGLLFHFPLHAPLGLSY